MPRYSIGDLVSYCPAEEYPRSLGIIIQVKDGDLVRIYWYIEHIIPNPRNTYDWLPASILEHAGGLKVLSRNRRKKRDV